MRNFLSIIAILSLGFLLTSFTIAEEDRSPIDEVEKYVLTVEDSLTSAVTTITADSEELKNEILTVYAYKNPQMEFVKEVVDDDKTTIIYKLTNTSTLTITSNTFSRHCGPYDTNHCRTCTQNGLIWTDCIEVREQK